MNPWDLLGRASAANVGGVDTATKARIEKYLQQMEGDVAAQGEIGKLYAEQPSQLDLSPLAALSDSLSKGGKLLQGYTKPKTSDDTIKGVSAFTELQRKGRGDMIDAINKGNQNNSLELLRLALTQGRSDREFERKNVEEAEKDSEAYSKRTENLPSLKYSLDSLDALVSKIPEGGDIPGVGKTGKFPSFLLTDEGSQVRQHAIDAMIAKVYLTSGKTINETEAERLLGSIGMKWDSGDREFLTGYNNLKKSIEKEVKQKAAGYRPEGMKLAKARGSLTAEDFKAKAPSKYVPGYEEDGYIFMGGDEKDQKNWKAK